MVGGLKPPSGGGKAPRHRTGVPAGVCQHVRRVGLPLESPEPLGVNAGTLPV